jgi:hypothetical protein
MRLTFKDKAVRELPFNAKLAARLIVLSQKHDEVDYRVELNPARPIQEQKKRAEQIQRYVDHYRTMKRCGREI